jgi:hypothetical protein
MPVRILNPWSYAYIQQLAQEAAYNAQREGLRPALAAEVTRSYRLSKRLNIPFLGSHVPEGWERTGEIGFVDTTGRAVQGDPAMPTFEFSRRVDAMPDKNIGFGVIEIGQTQALVAIYTRKEEHAQESNRPESGDQRRRNDRSRVTRRGTKKV